MYQCGLVGLASSQAIASLTQSSGVVRGGAPITLAPVAARLKVAFQLNRSRPLVSRNLLPPTAELTNRYPKVKTIEDWGFCYGMKAYIGIHRQSPTDEHRRQL